MRARDVAFTFFHGVSSKLQGCLFIICALKSLWNALSPAGHSDCKLKTCFKAFYRKLWKLIATMKQMKQMKQWNKATAAQVSESAKLTPQGYSNRTPTSPPGRPCLGKERVVDTDGEQAQSREHLINCHFRKAPKLTPFQLEASKCLKYYRKMGWFLKSYRIFHCL